MHQIVQAGYRRGHGKRGAGQLSPATRVGCWSAALALSSLFWSPATRAEPAIEGATERIVGARPIDVERPVDARAKAVSAKNSKSAAPRAQGRSTRGKATGAKAGGSRARKHKAGSTAWKRHQVIDCENLIEIGLRYAVRPSDIAAWNKLDRKRPIIRPGQKLLLRTRLEPPKREKTLYTVRAGDSWKKLAARFRVDLKRLTCWNRGGPRALRAGRTLTVWQEDRPRDGEKGEGEDNPLPLVAVRGTGVSVGTPDRGRLVRGIQMPENRRLYTVRNPRNSWGSSHTVEKLQLAIALFRRNSGFDRALVVCDISREHGGRFPPHSSHRSGRDVDVRLPLAPGITPGVVPDKIGQVDWDAVWNLVQALLSTGEVKYIFLSRSRQRYLYAAAKRAGANDNVLKSMIQYPRYERNAVVRHDSGHIHHIHVRFRCGDGEEFCRD